MTHPAAAGDGQTWVSPPFGITSRTLGDGFWDGYTQADAAGQADPPTVPLQQAGDPTIPEPATMTLVAMAWAALALSRRRIRTA